MNEEEILYLDTLKKSIKLDFKLKNNIIEFDGDYWHNNPKSKKRDLERDLELKNMDIKYLGLRKKIFIKIKMKL